MTRPESLPLLLLLVFLAAGALLWNSSLWALPGAGVCGVSLCAAMGLSLRRAASGGECNNLIKSKNLKGKVAIVTGANSGIGFYTALLLAEMGATVIITCRTVDQTLATAARLRKLAIRRGKVKNIDDSSSGFDVRTGFTLELDNFKSVKKFVAQFKGTELPLNYLVNNAGMMVTGLQFSKHDPLLELHTSVNFLGPLLLTELLMPSLSSTAKERGVTTRIIHVSSELHSVVDGDSSVQIGSGALLQRFRDVNKGVALAKGCLAAPSVPASFARYGHSKLTNVYTAHYCANTYPTPSSGVWACSVHPGRVITGFMNNLICRIPDWLKELLLGCFLKTSLEGAYTTVFACVCNGNDTVRYELPTGSLLPAGNNRYAEAIQSKFNRVIDMEKHFGPTVAKQLAETGGWKFVAPYFVDCRDRTLTELSNFGYSLKDAKEITEWGLREILMRAGNGDETTIAE